MNTIERAEVFVASPGRNFVTLRITTEDGVTGLGDATLNGRELAVAVYLPTTSSRLLIGRDPAPHRGHLAVPLQGRVLAARPGDHDARSPLSTRRCGTSRARSPGFRSTSCSAGAARDGVTGLRARQRRGRRRDCSTMSPATASSATRRSARRPAFPGSGRARYGVDRRAARFYEPAGGYAARPRQSGRPRPTCDFAPALLARLRERVRLRRAPAARRAPPAHPDRGGPARQGAGAVPAVLDGGPDPGREPGGVPADPQHTTTPLAVGEVLNSIWDCQQLITEQLIDYVRTTVVARRRDHPPAPDLRPRRPLPGPHRLARRRRPLADRHGRGAAPRPHHPELRHPGVHGATPDATMRSSAARYAFADGISHPGDCPGSASSSTRRRPRASRTTRVPAGRPPPRRLHPRLVTGHDPADLDPAEPGRPRRARPGPSPARRPARPAAPHRPLRSRRLPPRPPGRLHRGRRRPAPASRGASSPSRPAPRTRSPRCALRTACTRSPTWPPAPAPSRVVGAMVEALRMRADAARITSCWPRPRSRW